MIEGGRELLGVREFWLENRLRTVEHTALPVLLKGDLDAGADQIAEHYRELTALGPINTYEAGMLWWRGDDYPDRLTAAAAELCCCLVLEPQAGPGDGSGVPQ